MNTNKTIKIIYIKKEEHIISFINKGSKLTVEAKISLDILAVIYSNQFSLQDVKENDNLFNVIINLLKNSC